MKIKKMAKYSDSYRVRVSDADQSGVLKIPSLLEMFQEAAKDHAEALEIGSTNLAPMNLGWALYKLYLKIDRLPSAGEHIHIKTWPSTRNKVYTEREYVATDDLGDYIACARSQWVLFDLKKRRLERLSVLGEWTKTEEFPCEFTFDKLPSLPSGEDVKKANFVVRKDDIDMNGHVNNSVYLTWALEAVADEFSCDKRPEEVEICYISEVFKGQDLLSSCQILDDNTTLHLIMAEGKERVRARIKWVNA